MARDIEVKTRLTAEEYIALGHVAEHEGMTHAGLLRHLLKRKINQFVHEQIVEQSGELPRAQSGPNQDLIPND